MSENAEVAALLEEMADHLEARGVDYKPITYRRAADSIRAQPVGVGKLYEEGGEEALLEIEDVGEAFASKTVEYLETGTIEELEELQAELPVEMDALTAVEGVGPRTVKDLYDALGVETLDELEAAAEAGEIREVKGFGEKTEQNILEKIPFAREARKRSLLGEARPVADRVVGFLEESPAVERVDVAGSLRRWRPTIGDVDVLVASDDAQAVVDHFEGWADADDVIEAGESKASVRSRGMRVDLRVVVPAEFGAALQYFTGSKDHNVKMRNRAIEQGLKVNEYGVFDVSEVEDPDAGQRVGERIAGETEADVYGAIGMAWTPPELRENRGEVEAAVEGEAALPDLLTADDVRGDLHLHTRWSDGETTIERMAEAAAEFGHDYISVADHATGPGMVGGVGLEDEELREQIAEVREVADDAPVDVFAGVEANIGTEGEISVGDDVLAELDCVVASPHSGLEGDGTDRIVAAIEHPEVDVVGHPTGRMLNQRPGHDIDIQRVVDAAAEHETALEINANPNRLDLRSSYVKVAVDAGATISINTDAHRPASYELIRYGVHTARRGWAEPEDVLNCRDADGLGSFLGL
ncbi:DNA polymerase/3'-5' exonuclease PolX [Natronomonas salina]|uniref:DNA polymerase/3'-5' exonuclease PolX n=1 Tax=Natronomonas salina TaxID=1710540 RepID=UPI0015B48269|nr:DNA polymerase/3'-5' exonuclease PolX [Natronomonas salina]QLD88645.1 DNA polymerase/3'-5' exonuclease PolX [Natronomonas salina]